MKLLFDYQGFDIQKIGGVSKVFANIINEIKSNNYCEIDIGMKETDNDYLKEYGLIPPISRTRKTLFKLSQYEAFYLKTQSLIKLANSVHYDIQLSKLNQKTSANHIAMQQYDLFIPTFYDCYFLPLLIDKPFALTVHDLTVELFPKWYPLDDPQIISRKKLCPLASKIHVPTNSTKNDLVYLYNISPEKISVIPWATNVIQHKEYINLHKNKDYFLFVGTRNKYKNFIPLLIEYKKFHKDYPSVDLVCIGGGAFTRAEIKIIQELHLDDSIRQIYSSEYDLGNWYHFAKGLIFPSEYEGFGLPIIEAYSYGCPVILFENPCFREIGGDAALFFSFSVKSQTTLYDTLKKIVRASENEIKMIISKGEIIAKKYSWAKTGKLMFEFYRSAIND